MQSKAQNQSKASKASKGPKKAKGEQHKDVAGSGDHHPDHSGHISRLNRVKGQIEGIERMIVDRRYCPDIIAQLKAASSALKAIEAEVFKTHLRGCVKQAFSADDSFKSEEKIQEIVKLVY